MNLGLGIFHAYCFNKRMNLLKEIQVSVSDYLREGQDVSFQIENPEISPKFISIIEDINDEQFTIKVLDERF